MNKTWRQLSLEVITKAFTEIRKENPGLKTSEIMKIISREYYPFGERAYFPYKAWLKAIRDYKRESERLDGMFDIQGPLFIEKV